MGRLGIITLLILGIVFIGCGDDENPITYDCTSISPNYTTNIKAIMDTNCATSGCHNATTQANGLDYSTYQTTRTNAMSAAFLGSMQHLSSYDAMPQGGTKLPDSQLQMIYCWIEDGMPE